MGYSLLKALRLQKNCETYLVVSESARRTWKLETSIPFSDLENAANFCYDNNDLAAAISSGSFQTDGMIVIPCSMKTLSGIARGRPRIELTKVNGRA
jgi:4-hydroxy-3-polyprenylbenzoate decarboxylase